MDKRQGNREDRKVKITQDQRNFLMEKKTELQLIQGIEETSPSFPEDALSISDQELAELRNYVCRGMSPMYNADTLLQRLRAELGAEQDVSQRERERASLFEQLLQDTETERRRMEELLAQVQADPNRAEVHSHDALQDKMEKEELNSDIVRLTSLVQELQDQLKEEEETGQNLRDKYEADLSNYELQLRTLEEDKEIYLAQLARDHNALLQYIREEHREQVQQQLQTWQHHRDHFHQSSIESCGESLNMIKAHQEHVDQEVAREYGEDMDLNVSSFCGRNQLMENQFIAAASLSSWVEESLEDHSQLAQAGSDSFQPDGEDVLRRSVAQSFENHSSAKEVQEALERWNKATEALVFVKQELEAERELRLRCEETIRSKTQEGNNMKDKLQSYLQTQQERDERSKDETANLITELREENELLFVQLRLQEQLVKDVLEKKLAGDTVTNEVQTLFGRQLSVLREQRDRLQDMLDSQQAKNLTTSELLGQRTLEVDSSLEELHHLQIDLAERDESLLRIGKKKRDLKSRLFYLQQNLMNAEQALTQVVEEKAAKESCVAELEIRAQNAENELETAQAAFQTQLKDKDLDLQKLVAEREKVESEHREKESALETDLARMRESLGDQERAHAVAMETLLRKEAEKSYSAMEEAAAQLRRAHQEETCRLEEKHQEEVNDLNEEMQRKLSDLKSLLEEEQKKQIALIKQVHEREYQRETAELATRQREALSQLSAELKESMEAAHQAELLQTQTQQALELEALRLNLTNLHAAQLEVSQSALQRDKEVVLSELQESLRAGWSQDGAALQAQQQAELEEIREQNREQAQRVEQQHRQEKDDLKQVWDTQMLKDRTRMEEQQANLIEALKAEWQRASEQAQGELRSSLTETQEALSVARTQLEELQARRDRELHQLEEELSQASSKRDAATRVAEDLVASHKGVLQEHQDHARHLEELSSAGAERERQLQQQVERLQAELMTLKSSSEQEVGHLWTQLECMRVSRQELEELKGQLLARSSQVEDVERLKQEFSQQRRDLQEHNEAELENLRAYFEGRLRATEESNREEIGLLHRRLVKGAEENAALRAGQDSFLWEERGDEERNDLLAEINVKLESHKEELDSLRVQLEERHKQDMEHLRASMTLMYREQLLQVKTDLTDRYFSQIQDLKTKHSLELEQQRAKLSDNCIKEITKLRLQSAQEAARQVEREREESGRALALERQALTAQVRSEKAQVQDLQAQTAALLKGHEEQLKQVEEQRWDLVRRAEEKLKQDFVEQLRVTVLKAQGQEREMVGLELSQEKEEALGSLREELLSQAVGQLSALRVELERVAAKEREALGQRVRGLEEQLEEEQRRLHALRDGLENEQDPRILLARQNIQAQYERELLTAKHTMAMEVKELNTLLLEQAEAKLQDAQSRFQEQQKELEEKLSQEQEVALRELTKKHQEELESQKALLDKHVRKLELLEEDLQNSEETLQPVQGAELDSPWADLQVKHRAELEAQEAELQARHGEDMDELESRMLSNMDTLECTYLAEIQSIRDQRDQALQALRDSFDKAQRETVRGHVAEVDTLRAQHQAQLGYITGELRRALAQVRMEKSFTTESEQGDAQELGHTHGAKAHLEEQLSQSRVDSDESELQHQPPKQLDLHKAEGLMECCAMEKAALEQVLQQKETQVEELEEELNGLQVELQDLREERALLLRQRETLAEPLGDTEKALLEETQRLVQEKLDIQRQAGKDQGRLESQLKLMEVELEEQESCRLELEQQRRAQVEDLQLQTEVLEKQLRRHRQFIDEQAVEREQEREDFQLEIEKLEAQLRCPPRPCSAEGSRGDKIEDLVIQVENLQAVIKKKIEDYNALLLTKKKYQGNVAEQNEQIHKMAGQICELEQALLSRTESSQAHAQLEQEQHTVNEAFQQQLCTNCLQMSALQCDQDDPDHWILERGAAQVLREQLEAVQQDQLSMEEQVELQTGKLAQVQKDPTANAEEPLPFKPTNQESTCVSQLQKDSSLKASGEKGSASTPLVPLTQLVEKNQEIHRLNEEILQLQRKADVSKDTAAEEKQAEVEELRSQVELLHSDRDRLRRDREVEVEQLHEVIHKLQEELEQMGPTCHEVSTSPEGSPALHYLRTSQGPEGSLSHELTCLSLQSPCAHLREPQVLLEETREETAQVEEPPEECATLRARLSQRKAEVDLLTERLRQLEGEARQGYPEAEPLVRGEEGPGWDVERQQVPAEAQEAGLDRLVPVETLKALKSQVQEGKAEIYNLKTQRAQLRQRQGQLLEEVEQLKQEVTSKSTGIQHLNFELEERMTQRDVLTFAEETLAMAGVALKESEEKLARMKAARDALKVEVVALQEGLTSSTRRMEKLIEESQTKDRALADLEIHSQHLKCQLQGLQAGLAKQEEELAHQQRELESLRKGCSLQGTTCDSHGGPETSTPRRAEAFLFRPFRESPEVWRMLDGSEDSPPGLHASQLSVLSSLPMEASPLAPHSFQNPETLSVSSPGSVSATEPLSTLDCVDDTKVKELDDLYITGFEEWASDRGGSSVGLDQNATLKVELGSTECLNTSFVGYLRSRDMAVSDRVDSATESVEQSDELLSSELQVLLKRMHQEGHKVLSLSERPDPVAVTSPGPCVEAPPLTWQAEKRDLQQIVLSLRELLCKMADREPKVDCGDMDGRRELQQAVRSAFHSEWAVLRSELQTVMNTPGPQHLTSFMDQLQTLLKQQEEQRQQTQEQLLCNDRLGLQEELQSLRSLLLSSGQRSQEQLQQLQDSLNASQEESRHVDPRESHLTAGQLGGPDQWTQQREEQGSILDRAVRDAQQELHGKIAQLRTRLEIEEAESQACQEALCRERACVQRLQGDLDLERLHSQRRREEEEQAQQVLQLSLEEHADQISQLIEALEQERAVSSSLQSEQSRCEALIVQERSRAHKALRQLEDRRASDTRVIDTLAQERQGHARKLQEEARRHEEETSQDKKFIQELRSQLEQERRQGEEMAAMMERLYQQAIQTKRQLEEEVQKRSEAVQKEHEARAQLRAAVSGLQAFMQETGISMEAEKHKAAQLQAQLDALRAEAHSGKEKHRKRERKEQAERGQRHTSAMQRLYQVPVLLSERLAWQKESATMQAALRSAESELSLVTAQMVNQSDPSSSQSKIKHLYRKYLRAESFRKALVYQKKYLLLLLGRFMDSEQVTLTLIASMGVCPSPVVFQALPPQSSPVNRFRVAVLAVIAISRLSFLVRMWQSAFREGPTATPAVSESEQRAGPDVVTTAVLSPRQQSVAHNAFLTHDTWPRPLSGGNSPEVPRRVVQQVKPRNSTSRK